MPADLGTHAKDRPAHSFSKPKLYDTVLAMNRIILLITLAVFCIVQSNAEGAKESNESDFSLLLTLTYEETSKDSNGQTTSLRIRDRAVEYSYHYGGFPKEKTQEKRYSLSETEEKELIEYVIENRLNRNLEEIRPTEGIGVAVDLRLEVRMEGIVTAVGIVGRSRIWGSSPGKETNLENRDFCGEINSLLVFLKNRLGFDIVL